MVFRIETFDFIARNRQNSLKSAPFLGEEVADIDGYLIAKAQFSYSKCDPLGFEHPAPSLFTSKQIY